MVSQCLHYGDQKIPYKVVFVPRRQRKIAIHVHPDGRVQVDAPLQTPLAEVKQAVGKRSRWLRNHLERIKENHAHVLPREYVSGESHFYLGRRYVLKVRKSKRDQPSVKLRQGQLQVSAERTDLATIKSLLWDWYKDHAQILFERRLENLCQQVNWIRRKPEWKLLTMKKQWGSCSPRGVLSINPHLVKAPSRCVDYVLLHELCHLKVHNHSSKFYRLLEKEMPEWQVVKGRLDGMAELLLNT